MLNLAPHSFYTVACVDPPVVQFTSVGRKDSLRNVEATGEFTVSLTPEALFEQINATGTDFPPGTSEAEHCGVRLEPSDASACPGSPSRRSRWSARCTRRVRLGDSTVVFGRVRAHQRLGERRPRRAPADRAAAPAGPAGRQRVVDDRRGQGDPAHPLPALGGGPDHRRSAPRATEPQPGRCGATSSAASAPNASAKRARKLSRGRSYSCVPIDLDRGGRDGRAELGRPLQAEAPHAGRR